MKIVITIDDDIYDDYLKQGATLPKYGTEIDSLYEALWNGVPLPNHHGRLIDEDKVLDDIKKKYPASVSENEKCKKYARLVYYWAVKNTPTIIEGVKADESNN